MRAKKWEEYKSERVREREKESERSGREWEIKENITPRIIIDYDCKFIESLTRCNVIINGTITHCIHIQAAQYTHTYIHAYIHIPEIRVNDNKNNTIN